MRTIIDTTIGELVDVGRMNRWLDRRDLVEWDECDRWKFQMVELEPSVRTIRFAWYDDISDTASSYAFTWHLPYLQFMYCDPWFGVAATGKPYKLGRKLRMSPFPNTYESGLVCQDEVQSIEDGIATFFGSVFEAPSSWWPCRHFSNTALNYPNEQKPEEYFRDEKYCQLVADLGEDILKINWKEMESLGGKNNPFRKKDLTTILPFLHHGFTDEYDFG
jgi:hypothetical protein